jgi:23S rRNA (uracil1939-C5)-methyltransferase
MANRRRQVLPELKDLKIIDAGSDGRAVGKYEDRVVFVPFVVPGDVIDVQVTKKKKSLMEARLIKITEFSDRRTEPECKHFGVCGGCKWQNMKYEEQLFFKQKQVEESLKRIGKIDLPEISPIKGSEQVFFYRNKLEYTFSNKKWLTDFSKDIDFAERNMNGLGFHKPGMWDRILDIEKCYLQEEPSNAIRLAVRKYALENELKFYDVKQRIGLLRNLIIRNTSTGEIMVILVVNYFDQTQVNGLLNFVSEQFPQITSLMYIVNPKQNDTIYDLDVKLFKGEAFITEEMEDLQFKIGPKSFYQTNSHQAYELYKVAREFADLKGEEIVYDLYTGTGTIALFVAAKAAKVVGIESVPEAIEDAKENAALNKIENTSFFAGDMLKVLNDEFVASNGTPDVIITDPPRAGMHEKVVKQILSILPKRIVYVSCNPASQARDVALLDDAYEVKKVQPVDMFPHTHHVENVMLLELRS